MKTAARHVALFTLLALFAAAGAAAPAPDAFQTTPEGARYRDLQPGSGPAAAAGDVVTVHFTGWLDDRGRRGRELYDSRREGRPVSFVVGTDGVMPGWNAAVTGMRAGGQRLVMLPPELAWGARGVQGVVPGNAPVMFRFELVKLEKR